MNTCQFIAKERGPFVEDDKCGKPALFGSAWCGEHREIVYTRVLPEKKAEAA